MSEIHNAVELCRRRLANFTRCSITSNEQVLVRSSSNILCATRRHGQKSDESNVVEFCTLKNVCNFSRKILAVLISSTDDLFENYDQQTAVVQSPSTVTFNHSDLVAD